MCSRNRHCTVDDDNRYIRRRQDDEGGDRAKAAVPGGVADVTDTLCTDNLLEGCWCYVLVINPDSRRTWRWFFRLNPSIFGGRHHLWNRTIQSVEYVKNACGRYSELLSCRRSLTFAQFLLYLSAVGLTASMFGLGATLSNYLGQHVVESFGHVASLTGSLVLSIVPLVIFGGFMPETLGDRAFKGQNQDSSGIPKTGYVEMTN